MCFYVWYFACMIIQNNLYTLALGCIYILYMAIVLGVTFIHQIILLYSGTRVLCRLNEAEAHTCFNQLGNLRNGMTWAMCLWRQWCHTPNLVRIALDKDMLPALGKNQQNIEICQKNPRYWKYGFCTYIYHKNKPNVGEYTIYSHIHQVSGKDPKNTLKINPLKWLVLGGPN